MIDLLLIGVGILLTFGTAVFVASEFSLVALDPATVEGRAEEGDARAQRVLPALNHLSLELSSAQVGITLTTILLGYTTQPVLTRLLAGPLGSAGMAEAAATALAVTIALIIVNVVSMVFGELVPKNLALSDPLKTASFFAPLQRVFTTILKPVILALNGSANKILGIFGIQAAEHLSGGRSASELAALVRRSAEQGTLDVSTATLLTRSIGMGALTAVDVMTDRGRLYTLDRESVAADVISLARQTGHSRFPVIGEDLDDVLGFVHLRRAIAIPFERRAEVRATSQSIMTEPMRVPETMALAPLLVCLRDEGMQMAVVEDEYGGTAGIVTLEDVVEEVVGEVADEHDRRRNLDARRIPGGSWQVSGVMRPDELAWQTGLDVPDDGPYETLGGLVMNELGRIPVTGDEIHVADVVLTVEEMEGMRVLRLKVRHVDDESAAQAADSREAGAPGAPAHRGRGPGADSTGGVTASSDVSKNAGEDNGEQGGAR